MGVVGMTTTSSVVVELILSSLLLEKTPNGRANASVGAASTAAANATATLNFMLPPSLDMYVTLLLQTLALRCYSKETKCQVCT
mmetsp:Transcript_2606/g.4440  ORF Transcript_2606/g.4440 Transcript_2606/m.4440 type:complete len:84 (+) Transcript_2606:3168-3419(+)